MAKAMPMHDRQCLKELRCDVFCICLLEPIAEMLVEIPQRTVLHREVDFAIIVVSTVKLDKIPWMLGAVCQ